MRFFIGLHHPHQAVRFDSAFISVNALRRRQSAFFARDWIMDSGAFSVILKHHGYPHPVSEYAAEIRRWAYTGNLLCAVAQDYMCEPSMLELTGLTIADHQRLTIERYDELVTHDTEGISIMPVLQGYAPQDYVRHIQQYGGRLTHGQWVGVGSVCKRNGDPKGVLEVLDAVRSARPDLKLHGFGLKTTALKNPEISARLHTADSMAWSFAARKQGRDANSWEEAKRFKDNIDGILKLHQEAAAVWQ